MYIIIHRVVCYNDFLWCYLRMMHLLPERCTYVTLTILLNHYSNTHCITKTTVYVYTCSFPESDAYVLYRKLITQKPRRHTSGYVRAPSVLRLLWALYYAACINTSSINVVYITNVHFLCTYWVYVICVTFP